jgi:Secretion system C-terminal sorting domain
MKQTFIPIVVLIFIMINSIDCSAGQIYFTYPVNNQIITYNYFSDHAEFNLYFDKNFSYGSDGAYAELTIGNNHYYRDLEGSPNRGNSIPSTFELSGGIYTWTLTLHEAIGQSNYEETAHQTITFYVKYNLAAANDFGGGSIIIDGSTVASGTSSNLKLVGENIAVGAIDQSYGGYNYIWNTNGTNNSVWKIQRYNTSIMNINGATSRNYNRTVQSNDNNATLIADLKKLYNVTFQNQGHQISINGSNYSSSGTVQVVEANPAYASTDYNNYTSNGLNYSFAGWTNNGGATYSNPVTPISNSTYTAYYTVTPNASYSSQNLHVGTTLNDNIHIYWTDNQNSIVDHYYIYRKVGYRGTPVLIGSVGRGVQQCIDECYYLQQYPNGTEVLYEVLEYSSYYNSYSYDNSWADTYGYYSNQKLKNNNVSLGIAKEIPTEYKIENYPNPFNPTTLISYQLPQDGYVTLKVYDILGKEIATLVNENKTAGYYKVNFDASRLTSGVYIYRISSNNFSLSKKMLLTK